MSTPIRGQLTRGAVVAACLGVALGLTTWIRATAAPIKPAAVVPTELFDAIKRGDVSAQMVMKNSREGQLLLRNLTNRPLNVQLPEAFGGSPILAQVAGAGIGNRPASNSSSRNSSQNQSVGGGIGGGGGGGIGGGGGGGGFFNIAPEKTGKVKFNCVCLEHGKPDPNPHVRYQLKQLEDVTTEPGVREVVTAMVRGATSQRVAQAAAWSLNNHMTWEQLAAKKINHLGRPDEPYFSAAEVRAAASLAQQAQAVAQSRETEKTPVSSSEVQASAERLNSEAAAKKSAQ